MGTPYWKFLSSFQVASPLTKLRVTNSSMMSNLKVSKFTAPHHQVLWSQLNLYKSIPIAPILLLPIPKICCSVLKARLRESQTKSSANVENISIKDLYQVRLSHTHSIVCDNDLGGLFLGSPKSRQMAAHDLKIHFNFFSSFYIRKYLKCWKEFSHWLRKYVFRFKSMSFCNHWLESTCFFGFKRGDPNFF